MRTSRTVILLLVIITLTFTGCDLISKFLGGGDDDAFGPSYFFGMDAHDGILYISAPESHKVTTIAQGEDISPEDFPTFDLPHGLVYDPDTHEIWICDPNSGKIFQYGIQGAGDWRTEMENYSVGTQPVNVIIVPEFQVGEELEPRFKRLVVADREENAIFLSPFDTPTHNTGAFNNENGWTLQYLTDDSGGYIDMFYDETTYLLYVVSDEYFGFQTIDLASEDPPTSGQTYLFTGSSGITQEEIDYGCTGITMYDGKLYINTGGRVIRCNADGTEATVLCVLEGIYPDNEVMYVDIIIANDLKTDGFDEKSRLEEDPYYIYIPSGPVKSGEKIPAHLLRCSIDGGTIWSLEIGSDEI